MIVCLAKASLSRVIWVFLMAQFSTTFTNWCKVFFLVNSSSYTLVGSFFLQTCFFLVRNSSCTTWAMVSSLLSLNFMLILVIVLSNFSLIGIITWSSFWTKLSMGMFWCLVSLFQLSPMQHSTNFSKSCVNINWCAFLFQAPHMLVQISRHDFSLT